MDWAGIQTAYLDRERQRLGLPSRLALEEKRAMEARRAAESASQLESAGVARDRMRAETEAFPVMQQAILDERAARTRNYDETTQVRPPTPGAGKQHVRLKNGNVGIVDLESGKVTDTGVAQAEPASAAGEGREPRSGWQPQFDATTGAFMGYYHPATQTFRAPGGGGLPAGAKPGAPSAGERESLALGSVPIRAGDNMRKALAATREAEKAAPMDPSTWTGPIAGRAGGAYRGMVDTSGPAGDFEQSRREARALVYALSGKQINESEQKWLDQILPRLSDRGVEQQIERYDRFVNYLRLAKQKGYSDPFAVAQAQFDQELPSAAGQPSAAAPAQGAKTTVRTPQEAAALPSGTVFFTPDGKRRIRP